MKSLGYILSVVSPSCYIRIVRVCACARARARACVCVCMCNRNYTSGL